MRAHGKSWWDWCVKRGHLLVYLALTGVALIGSQEYNAQERGDLQSQVRTLQKQVSAGATYHLTVIKSIQSNGSAILTVKIAK